MGTSAEHRQVTIVKDTVLFSDVHLKPSIPPTGDFVDFTRFLRHIDSDQVERIICMGDLFDFWYEYKHVFFGSYFEVLRLLARLHEEGVALHLFRGNHDLWAGAQLEALTGMRIHREPTFLPFGGREALLLHGDGLNPQDYGYRLFRHIASNRLAQHLFRHIHPDNAMALAQYISQRSRTKVKTTDPAAGPEVEVVRGHAHGLIADGKAQIVICGHSHLPVIEQVEVNGHSGLFINPGDWPNHRSYVLFSEGEFRLLAFC